MYVWYGNMKLHSIISNDNILLFPSRGQHGVQLSPSSVLVREGRAWSGEGEQMGGDS